MKELGVIACVLSIVMFVFMDVGFRSDQKIIDKLRADLKDRDTTIAELQKRPDLPELLNNPDVLNNEAAEFIDFPGNYSVVWKPYSAKEIAEGRAEHYEGMYLSVHADRKFVESGYLMYIRYPPQPLKLK